MLRVKEICKAQGVTLKELAAKLEISETGLRKILKGNPTIGTLEKIATVLGVGVPDLLPFPECDTTEEGQVVHITCPHCGKVLCIELKKE